MKGPARPGVGIYLLTGILFGTPAMIAAHLSFSRHLPLLFTPLVLLTWGLPVMGWLYLLSLKLGATDKTIYFERFFFQRFEVRFADITSVRFGYGRRDGPRTIGPFLHIHTRTSPQALSIALNPFDKTALSAIAKTLKEKVPHFEDLLGLADDSRAAPPH